MYGLRRNLLATVSLLALGTSAPAADWTGFYIGLNAGIASQKPEFKDLGDDGGNPLFGFMTLRGSSGTGATFGGQIGYNWQIANLVFGFEGDLNWVNSKSNDTFLGSLNTTARLNSLGTARGRVGFVAFPSTLIYATGGVASGRIQSSLGDTLFTSNLTRTGWVAGGGIEYMFVTNQTIRFEALYNDLGSWVLSNPSGCPGNYRTRFSHTETIVRGALNFKW